MDEVPARDVTDEIPLTDLQHAYLLGELGDFPLGGPAVFFEEYQTPELDVAALRSALQTLMRRHEMLRATFHEDGLLRVHRTLPVPLETRTATGPGAEQKLRASREELYATGPPLHTAPFVVRVFTTEEGFRIQVCGRLAAVDGASGEIFAQELRSLLAGETLEPLGYGYAAYRREMTARQDRPEHQRARAYWIDRLDSLPPAPELPRTRETGSRAIVRRRFALPAKTWQALAERSRRNRLTPTMTVATAFAEVLRHWAKDPAFCLNLMYGQRTPVHPEVDRVIGSFSDTLLLACTPKPTDRTFAERARTLRRQLLTDMQHGSYAGVSVLRELNRRSGNARGAAMPVVFTSMLSVGEEHTGVFLEHLGWKRIEGRVHTPQVSLDHQVFLADHAMVVQWDCAEELYPEGLLDEMFAGYERVLTRLACDDEAWRAEAFDLTPAAQLAVRRRVNATEAPVPPHTLHGLFLDRALEDPYRPAVITADSELSYGELARRAQGVAGTLRHRGVGPGSLVGVTARRGIDQITALLGVLMSGAAYVPISPEWPERRRDQVVGLAGIEVTLVDGDTAGGAAGVSVGAAAGAAPLRDPADDSEALAYVVFTSGTTGAPKGVMIRHQSAANTILDVNERFGVTAEDRVLAVSEYTFDLSVYDVFGLFAAGGAVVVPGHEQAREVTHLHDLAVRHRVTVWNSVPAYLGMFVDFIRSGGRHRLDTLRLALVSGDWVPITLARELAEVAPAARCVSLGGATEASIWSNYFPVPARPPSEWVSIPYGYPLRNQRFRVLDGRLADRPDWVPGELYIAGRGLADGYLGAPEQTDRAFVTCPDTDERLYRTGDWGRYWPDGVLEFLGREDPQVKINGFRVELGEVESTLLGHPAVSDAVVVTRRGARGSFLVGFVVADRYLGRSDEPHRDLLHELKAHLRAELPRYMVPAAIEVRAQLPLTPNGKVDRGALVAQAAGLSAPAPAIATPRTDTERRLARLWTRALGVETVGVSDDFFETGGTSLTAAQLMNGVEQEFGIRLPLAALYTNATVESLAPRLDGSSGPHSGCLVPLARHGRPPVVLVHPVGGDLLCYRPLVSALADRYDVFGVQAVPDTAATSVTELARRYLREVRHAIPAGPYRIAGWSLGGVVAHAMGQLLVAAGRDCSVVMIDPWLAPSGGVAATESALVSAFLSNLTRGEPVEGVPDGADPLRGAWSRLSLERPDIAALDGDELARRYRTFADNTRALLAHTVSTAPGLTPVVIEASERLSGTAGEYLAPWRVAAASAPARYLRVAGDHFAVLEPAAARRIAQLVAEAFGG